jgi:signal transduction histidine kinase
MPHPDLPKIDPPLKCSFDQIYDMLLLQNERKISGLFTTGDKRAEFQAEAKETDEVGKFILLSHGNRIYPCCWGNRVNHMESGGQRIGQYSRPLDNWCSDLLKSNKTLEITIPFKPRARLIPELGDQLIKNESIAFLELVKNSYDACARRVDIQLRDIEDKDKACIIIEDNGFGMDFSTIVNVWMEPGTDNKAGRKTNDCGRTPLGEKGIGRFAAHKIGNEITLISKKEGCKEVYLNIDWTRFNETKYLADIPVTIVERSPQYFLEERTGTRIIIQKIKQNWSKNLVREIYRSVKNMQPPFQKSDVFNIEFDIDNKKLIEGILTWQKIKDFTLFNVKCIVGPSSLYDPEKDRYEIKKFCYTFTPYPAMDKLNPRLITMNCDKKDIQNNINFYQDKKEEEKLQISKKVADSDGNEILFNKHKIGEISFEASIFDFDTRILKLGITEGKQDLKDYLRSNGGIRIYRDGIRVYDYGEPGNDWLNLGGKRVNTPSEKISNNIIIGAIDLKREESVDLIEKTNREGFIENDAVIDFVTIIEYIIDQVEYFRNQDKEKMRIHYGPKSSSEPVISSINELKDVIEEKIEDLKLKDEIIEKIQKIEKDYSNINEILLKSAGAGLSLSVVFHQFDKIFKELKNTIEKENSSKKINILVSHLEQVLSGYSVIVGKSTNKNEDLSTLIEQSIFICNERLYDHGVTIVGDYKNYRGQKVRCNKNFIITSIVNIIDNSLWWMKYSNTPDKEIFFTISDVKSGFTTIIIADNGPGFTIPTDEVIKPFVTRKPNGTGLGLYITNEVMKLQKGELWFPEFDSSIIPEKFKQGAIVGLAFRKPKEDQQ